MSQNIHIGYNTPIQNKDYCTLLNHMNKNLDKNLCNRCYRQAETQLVGRVDYDSNYHWIRNLFTKDKINEYNNFIETSEQKPSHKHIDSDNKNKWDYFTVSFSTAMFIFLEIFFWIASSLLVHKYKESFTNDNTDENSDTYTDTPSTQTKKSPAYIAGVSMIVMNVFTSLILLYLIRMCVNANLQSSITFPSWIIFVFGVFAVLTIIKIVLVAAYSRF